MTELSDLLTPEAVLAGMAAANKKTLFQQLGAAAANAYDLDAKLVTECLAAREKLGSTGFGSGIAIPHAKLDGLRHVVGVFVRLAQPVDFAAVDDLPVDLVFMLLSPTGAGAEHLKALACVSRKLRDRNFAAKLRGAGSTDALFALLAGVETRDAA
ncbi:PTS IIA-like nitrogen regulatory protein PtsN [Sphingomonas sp. HF-S4]|uniref:PTS IIA-like nitrogen regulatory protein PtsN n=1 Tax=Sphingomonas agrestis TaxID=3080540 RepID=A0ABU3YB09_9SPHN|nr:PTS IIA-like nitrogen regulatory protein PtsN [Sphingomonas sp. HF-S4]MDV3458586.1 PTS IIA-like nitrogen regulatory protein PtsN [Sphingomonas sp. HF-S4]